MTDRAESTRREFLLKLARGAAYTAPVVTTFAVAPDLLAVQSTGKKGGGPTAMTQLNTQGGRQPSSGARESGRQPPSEKYRPPSKPPPPDER